jgi:hypothetical protein
MQQEQQSQHDRHVHGGWSGGSGNHHRHVELDEQRLDEQRLEHERREHERLEHEWVEHEWRSQHECGGGNGGSQWRREQQHDGHGLERELEHQHRLQHEQLENERQWKQSHERDSGESDRVRHDRFVWSLHAGAQGEQALAHEWRSSDGEGRYAAKGSDDATDDDSLIVAVPD